MTIIGGHLSGPADLEILRLSNLFNIIYVTGFENIWLPRTFIAKYNFEIGSSLGLQ